MPPLYKFISDPGVAGFVAAGTVKFTPIADLNDPSELSPTMHRDDVLASLRHMREQGYSEVDLQYLQQQGALLQELAPKFQAIRVPNSCLEASQLIQSPFYNSIPILEQLLIDTAIEIASKVGILCLTSRIDSLPMWAHYAANATGFVVEFDSLQKIFPGDNSGVLRQVRPVSYSKEVSGITFDPQSHENLFFSKYQDWKYEQEFRVVMPLADCRIIQNGSANNMYLHDIPINCIKRIFLGWHITATNAKLIKKNVNNVNPNVEVLHAHFIRGKVELI